MVLAAATGDALADGILSQSESWLNLGISGAALLIVLIVIVLMFRQQAASVDKLCTKIDALITSFGDNNLKLNETILTNDRDQKELLRCLAEQHQLLQDTHKRVVRIDTRLYNQGGSNNEREQDTGKRHPSGRQESGSAKTQTASE